ncbi:hypothetical protein QTP88_024577 [Uroleucon formosanum]
MVYECRVGKFCSQISIIYKYENKRKIIKKFPDELDKRINTYSVVVENFLFLTRLHVESTIDVEESVNKFISVYKDDVDDSIKYEIVLVKQFWDQLKLTFDRSDVLKSQDI